MLLQLENVRFFSVIYDYMDGSTIYVAGHRETISCSVSGLMRISSLQQVSYSIKMYCSNICIWLWNRFSKNVNDEL